ncbi:MAG: DNA-binding domain-containing protein [Hyphomicrobium sp.]|nr:DNA-binding domain-containing protein [Hyphomicrobium sp.]
MPVAFAKLQATFAGALLDAERPVPGSVTSHTARTPHQRFAVYRNNVVAGLIAALRTQFPATERIVGDEFFAAMARIYVVTEPPRSPILVTYGYGFPNFIANFAPAADIAYLADVARLEAARTRAYHAGDAAPLDASHWQDLDPDALAGVRVALHPSVQILRSPYPIVTIWSMNAGDHAPASIEDCAGEDAVVARPLLEVQVRQLPAGGAAFLEVLAAGAALGDAAQAALNEQPEFDLAANLAGLIGAGLAAELFRTPIQKDPKS